MPYNDLHDLLQRSSSTRRYFLSLPVAVQMRLHEHNAYIHSAAALRERVRGLEAYDRAVVVSDALFIGKRPPKNNG